MIEWLEAMKKVPLYAQNIMICLNNEVELENLTDPNLYNTQINNLQLEFLNGVKISSKTIENLKAIYPNSITIKNYYTSNDESTNQVLIENFTKLLSNLDNTSLEMDSNTNYYRIKLEFSNVILKVVESNEECSYIRAKSVEILYIDEESCLIK